MRGRVSGTPAWQPTCPCSSGRLWPPVWLVLKPGLGPPPSLVCQGEWGTQGRAKRGRCWIAWALTGARAAPGVSVLCLPRTKGSVEGPGSLCSTTPLPPHDCVCMRACVCVCVLGGWLPTLKICYGFSPPSATRPRFSSLPGGGPWPVCPPGSVGVDFGCQVHRTHVGSLVRCASSLSEPVLGSRTAGRPPPRVPLWGFRPLTSFWEEIVWPVSFCWTHTGFRVPAPSAMPCGTVVWEQLPADDLLLFHILTVL